MYIEYIEIYSVSLSTKGRLMTIKPYDNQMQILKLFTCHLLILIEKSDPLLIGDQCLGVSCFFLQTLDRARAVEGVLVQRDGPASGGDSHNPRTSFSALCR